MVLRYYFFYSKRCFFRCFPCRTMFAQFLYILYTIYIMARKINQNKDRICTRCGRWHVKFATVELCIGCYSTYRQRRIRAKWTIKQKRMYALHINYNKEISRLYWNSTKCELCGFERKNHYNQIHHKDHNNNNNNLNNILAICYYCHKDIHRLEGYVRHDQPPKSAK